VQLEAVMIFDYTNGENDEEVVTVVLYNFYLIFSCTTPDLDREQFWLDSWQEITSQK